MVMRHPAAAGFAKARHRQHKGDPVRRLADTARPQIGRAIARALLATRKDFHAEDIASGGVGILRQALEIAFGEIRRAYMEGGRHAGEQIAAMRPRARKSVSKRPGFGFSIDTPSAQSEWRKYQDQLIREMETQQRDLVEAMLKDGQDAGLDPEETAARIKTTIGLTAAQARYVENYRAALASLDPSSLTRNLTDDDADSEVRQAISAGAPLPQERIDALTDAYADNWIGYRSQTIADTESVRSVNMGLHQGYAQAIDDGLFPHGAVRRFWKIADGENVCPICRAIPELNPDGVAVGEPFQGSDDEYMDTPAHPNCRCSEEFVTDLAQADMSAGDAEE